MYFTFNSPVLKCTWIALVDHFYKFYKRILFYFFKNLPSFKDETYEDGCEYSSALLHPVPFNLHYGNLDKTSCGLELGLGSAQENCKLRTN
jgi:hypothetical protein